MKKNVFLNKKYLIKWTKSQSAFLVQSPFTKNAGIWWARSWLRRLLLMVVFISTLMKLLFD